MTVHDYDSIGVLEIGPLGSSVITARCRHCGKPRPQTQTTHLFRPKPEPSLDDTCEEWTVRQVHSQ